MSLLRLHHLHKSRGILGSAVYSLLLPLFGPNSGNFALASSACQFHTFNNLSEARFLCEAGVTDRNFSSKLNRSFEEANKCWCSKLARRAEMATGKDKWLGKSDPSSFSNPEDFRTDSLHLNWTLDFDSKQISGSVVHELTVLNQNAVELILDTRDLLVTKVLAAGMDLKHKVGSTVSSFGEPLIIQIGEVAQAAGSGNKITVEIQYSTTEKCTGLQWLDPLQTAGKRHPYMFSQCQAIHARSLMPCQDTPFVKAKYTATVTVPKDLQALMSAVPVGEPEVKGAFKLYQFDQNTPIPSYLTAIAVGDIVGKTIGPRSKVWAEKEIVDKAAFEFSDTEKFVATAEKLVGKYVWGQYDILVLPPSFPYGGMENPCLTFATPTLLAGDKSLANVIAHEIAHSWTGNLVTNKDWQHFWLNEGFTVFLERKILGAMQGEQYRQFAAIGGWNELTERIKEMKPDNPLTQLVVDLNGVDPDDAFSIVPYEKGSAFLYYLEQKVGGPAVFEPFLAEYIQENSYKSIDTNVFIANFTTYFQAKGLSDKISDVNWDAWLKTPGMPLVENQYDQTLRNACVNLKNRWVQWDTATPSDFQKSDIDNMFPLQVEQFLQELINDGGLPLEKVKAMDTIYGMKERKNSEIRFRWIRLSIKARSPAILPSALQFINEQGRMKYVRPIYRELYAWEEMRQTAIQNYRENSKFMMHVLAKMLLQDLHLKD